MDASGCKTEQYEKLRRVNAEVRRIATTYMRFRNVATHFVGFDGMPDTLGASGPFRSIKAMDGKPLLVGEMKPRGDAVREHALFVVAADDPYDRQCISRNIRVDVRCCIGVVGCDGPISVKRGGDGMFTIPLRSNQAILLLASF